MIVLTNSLTETPDEGNIKVMSKIIKTLRVIQPETEIITYNNPHAMNDYHVQVNKFLLSTRLRKIIRSKNAPVLFCAATARVMPMAIRTAVASFYSRRKIAVVLTMPFPNLQALPQFLLKISGAKFIVLSLDMYETYTKLLSKQIVYIKAGADTKRFSAVDADMKMALRRKYGVPEDKPVVLHVGHMQEGRNMRTLLSLDESVHVVLVISTYEYDRRDMQLRQALARRRDITLIEDYVANIEEIYQLADVYFFPVMSEKNCISVPLSVLEAAACNLPVVCTEFGELKQFNGNDGFFFIDSFDPENLNNLVKKALQSNADTRSCVLEYDWERAVRSIMQTMQRFNNG